jgi:hypothetical protein
MVHLSLGVNVLARPHQHASRRCDIHHWRSLGVLVRNPYRHRKSVGGASEGCRDSARYLEEQRRYSILICFDVLVQ